jgi:hypothetical protein
MYDLKEYNKQYYLKNKERRLAEIKAWRAKNHDYVKEYEKQRYLSNKERHNEYSRSYYHTHKENFKAYQLNRTARLREIHSTKKIDKLNERLKSEGLDELIKA